MAVAESIKDTVGLGHGHDEVAPATRQEMSDARLPLPYRDAACAKLLISLNSCRQREYYLPWKCEDERHGYEKCMYVDFNKRKAKQDEIRAEKAAAQTPPSNT